MDVLITDAAIPWTQRVTERMHHVRLAGTAPLALMPLAGKAKSPFERRQIVFGPVLADLGFQFVIKLFDGIRRRRGYDGF